MLAKKTGHWHSTSAQHPPENRIWWDAASPTPIAQSIYINIIKNPESYSLSHSENDSNSVVVDTPPWRGYMNSLYRRPLEWSHFKNISTIRNMYFHIKWAREEYDAYLHIASIVGVHTSPAFWHKQPTITHVFLNWWHMCIISCVAIFSQLTKNDVDIKKKKK